MRALSLIFVILYSTSCLAFFSLMDTTQLKKQGEYKILGEGQILFDDPKGFNLNSRFSTGLSEESEIQFEAGLGSIDYYMGAFWKWIPFPDTNEQPGLGLRTGATFANINNYSTYGFNVTPMISKMIDSDFGRFTPYGGIQMGLQKNTNDTFFSMQATIGLEWTPSAWDHPQIKDFNFMLEYGVEVDDSFDYLSFGASYNF